MLASRCGGALLMGVAGALGLAGCASSAVLLPAPAQLDALRGRSLTTVTYAPTAFTAVTADRPAAAATPQRAGQDIVVGNALADPADEIAFQLTAQVARRLAPAGFIALPAQDPAHDSPAALSSTVGKRGVVFDVKTLAWGVDAFAHDRSRYRLSYSARARLLDAASGALIGQVPCDYVAGDAGSAPTYDELLANQGARLKAQLGAATATCSALIAQTLLAAAGPPSAGGVPALAHPASDVTAAARQTPAALAVPALAPGIDDYAAPPVPVPVPDAEAAPAATLEVLRAIRASAADETAPGSAATAPLPEPAHPPGPTPRPLTRNDSRVLAAAVTLRNAPTPRSPRAAQLSAGTRVSVQARIVNAAGAWLYLVAAQDRGWLRESDLAAPASAAR